MDFLTARGTIPPPYFAQYSLKREERRKTGREVKWGGCAQPSLIYPFPGTMTWTLVAKDSFMIVQTSKFAAFKFTLF